MVQLTTFTPLIVFLSILAVPPLALGQGQGSTKEECSDKVPIDGYDCKQQQKWGKCTAYWMVLDNYCEKTCGRCMTLEARLNRLMRTSIALDKSQSADSLAKEASSMVKQQEEQNQGQNFFSFEVSLFLNDVDFLLLLGAAGVVYQERLQTECPGGAGAHVRTLSSSLEEFVLAVQLDGNNNQDARFIYPVVVECPDSSGQPEIRFEILHVEASFPNFVNEVQAIYSQKIANPNDGTI
eukprot:TRINITY_DN3276_c0_g1_i1.p1 TRINITY_DN3276_c0_g1~~TRINITY_DN3276_c0_g1_i1.p1  ORF type:complete len:238 (-),score=39.48 TRINITY_DN3276_c0_g1_i1:489-1202(-)